MTSMNVSLPKDLKEFVDQQVADGGYSTTSEYIRELIRYAKREASRQKLEALLLEGLDSGPATPMTEDDWKSLRAKAENRWAQRANEQADR